MANTFGNLFRITTWGESHGGGVGVVVDGCPPRLALTEVFGGAGAITKVSDGTLIISNQADVTTRNGQATATMTVQAGTLVWHEGMANWLPYGQVNPARAATLTAEPPPPAIGSLPPSGSAPTTGTEVVCVQCNRMFPREETIQYGTAYVCATCKPTFVQKLKEGAVTPTYLGAMDYAGFWIRFGAKLIDGLAIMIVVGVPVLIFVLLGMKSFAPGRLPGFRLGF